MATDSLAFLDAVEGLPEQLAAAHAAAAAIPADAFPSAEGLTNIVVCGMGGSGISGDVLSAATNDRLRLPVTVLKQIRIPAFVGPNSLVFAMSYSGGTEETVSMARAAVEAGARLVCVSKGGALGELAAQAGALHIPCPDGYLPRAAVGTLVAPLFVTLHRMGLLDSGLDDLTSAQQQLARRRDVCARAVDAPRNVAKELARKIGRTFPLVYGGGGVGLMGVMANAALKAGGKVIGIIPTFLLKREAGHPALTETVVVETMHQRKLQMFERSDAIVVLPGGIGTLEEFFEVLSWRTLNLHDKPIVIVDLNGYWGPLAGLLKAVVDGGFADKGHLDHVAFVSSIDEVLPAVQAMPGGQLPEKQLDRL